MLTGLLFFAARAVRRVLRDILKAKSGEAVIEVISENGAQLVGPFMWLFVIFVVMRSCGAFSF
ncbi:MAG: hypothetical protein AAGJ87_10425 [Pseudomonadota bacterium]